MRHRARMTMRCDVERDVNDGTEASPGYAAAPDWQPLYEAVPCRLWPETSRDAVTTDRDSIIGQWRMTVPRDSDVQQTDRIARVTDRLGTLILDGPLELLGAPMPWDDALMLQLRTVD